MRRREFIAGLGVAAAWPVVARAQQPGGLRRLGVLMNGAPTAPDSQAQFVAFSLRLRQLGWAEGQNLIMDVRWNAGDAGHGDKDQWAYRFMRGWKANEHIDFDFYDAHDLTAMTLKIAYNLAAQAAVYATFILEKIQLKIKFPR
jgi:hypothetical protein